MISLEKQISTWENAWNRLSANLASPFFDAGSVVNFQDAILALKEAQEILERLYSQQQQQ